MIHIDGANGHTILEGKVIDLLSEVALALVTLTERLENDADEVGVSKEVVCSGLSTAMFSACANEESGILKKAILNLAETYEEREKLAEIWREGYGEFEEKVQKKRSREEMGGTVSQPIRRRVGRSRRS